MVEISTKGINKISQHPELLDQSSKDDAKPPTKQKYYVVTVYKQQKELE